MVEPNQVRIGNYLLFKAKPCIVTAIGKNSLQVEALSKGGPLDSALLELSYLPLTEEWMRKFSGDESGYLTVSELERTTDSSDMVILSTIECYLHEDGFLRVCAYEYDKQPDGTMDTSDDVITLGYKHIRYVHQLQNFYFALSGEELS